MTTWGAPLTGAQMKLLRAAGLPDGTEYHKYLGPKGNLVCTRTINNHTEYDGDCRWYLATDHPAYTLLEKGWLDIPNVRLWFGGDKAPSDWDGERVLFSDGGEQAYMEKGPCWVYDERDHNNIIAYIAKAEATKATVEASHSAVENFLHRSGWEGNQDVELALDLFVKDMAENGSVTITKDEAVLDFTENGPKPRVSLILGNEGKVIGWYDDKQTSINRMTEAEAAEWHGENACLKPYEVLQALGLIKPEPTRAERFWQGKERNSLSRDEAVKALVREAIKFGQENPE